MPHFPKTALLAAALAGVLSAPLAVRAQQGDGPIAIAPLPLAIDVPAPRGITPGLGLAAHLAAMQVYLGITPDQLPAWQDYCQALIGFAEPSQPSQPTPALLAPERMAQDSLHRAARAQGLLEASATLRGVLDPAQIQRLMRSQPPGPTEPAGAAPHHPAPDHDH